MKGLNGWQRIGIILSVLWSLFIVGLASNAYIEFLKNEECLAEETKLKETGKWTLPEGFTSCSKAAELKKPPLVSVLGFLLLPIVAGWLIAYVIVWTTKWIVSGFKES